MPKKIRLMDDATATATAPETTDSAVSAPSVDKQTVETMMKYLEAIDWKLWEMLKIRKADQEGK